MKTYLVTLPIAGSISCIVEAGDDAAAIEQALQKDWLKTIELTTDFELEQIDSYEALVNGNFSNVDCLEASAEVQDEDE